MNESGDVVGESLLGDGTTKTWPFVYFNDTNQLVDLRDLLTQADLDLWRWDLFQPKGINSLRQICGQGLKHNSLGVLQAYAVRITLPQQPEDAALVEIVGPDGDVVSWADDINEFGDVTGGYFLPGEISRAFAYSDGFAALDIGDLGGARARGFAINDHGEIAGYSENSNGDSHAFLFIPGTGMQDLGIIKKAKGPHPFTDYSYGNDLNDSAVVVGRSVAGTQNGSVVDHAFREAGNGMVDLKTLDGDTDSGAMSINSLGEIVGWSERADGSLRGFLYSDENGMLELNSLIDLLPEGTADINRWGIRINNSGEICGSFWFTDGSKEAFLLTPNE